MAQTRLLSRWLKTSRNSFKMAGTAVLRKAKKKTVKKELNLDIILKKIYKELEKAQDTEFRVFVYDIKLRTEEEQEKGGIAPEKRITKIRVLTKVAMLLWAVKKMLENALERAKELNEKEIERVLKYAHEDTKSAYWLCVDIEMQKGDLKTNIKKANEKMKEAMKAVKRAIKVQESIIKYSQAA